MVEIVGCVGGGEGCWQGSVWGGGGIRGEREEAEHVCERGIERRKKRKSNDGLMVGGAYERNGSNPMFWPLMS